MEVIFIGALALGVLLSLGSALDLTGHDEGDSEHGPFSLIGWGRTPVLLSLTIATLLFGGTGLIATWIGFTAILAVSLASIVSYLLGAVLTHAFGRAVPALESYNTTHRDLLGSRGQVTVSAIGDQLGIVQVRIGNDLHQFSYRNEPGQSFEAGSYVYLADVDRTTRIAKVLDDPTRWGY